MLKNESQGQKRPRKDYEQAIDERKQKHHRRRPSYLMTATLKCGIEKDELWKKMESLLSRKVHGWTASKVLGRKSRELAYLFS